MSSGPDSDSEAVTSAGTAKGTPTNTSKLPSSSSEPSDQFSMSVSDTPDTTKVFGMSLQQFAQRLTAALGRFNITVILSDTNFTDWAPSILESLQTLCLSPYLTIPTYHEESMTMARHEKLKEVLTTWMISHMDADNARRTRSHLTSYSSGVMTTAYDPHTLWTFINSYHCSITEARLTVITSTLHSLKQSLSDNLTSHLDKFNLVLNEFCKFSGEMSETQAARLLINNLRPEYDTTVKMIYMTVKDLTIPKVSSILLESKVQSGGWANSAVYQLSSASANANASASNSYNSKRAKCSQNACVGPHNRSECFELPQNAEKKRAWPSRKQEGQHERSTDPLPRQVSGVSNRSKPLSRTSHP